MLKKFFRYETATPVDPLIDAVLEEMNRKGPESEDYPRLLTYLERLNEVKTKDRQDPVSRDTIVIVAGNLLLTFLIVAYEQKHVWTSKGLNHIIRPRTPGTMP